MQAYKKYAEKNGLKVEVLTEEYGHAIAKISGKKAWEFFKNEPGKHVVQRVPPTERNGRRQTSVTIHTSCTEARLRHSASHSPERRQARFRRR